jgi:hypothetical protein
VTLDNDGRIMRIAGGAAYDPSIGYFDTNTVSTVNDATRAAMNTSFGYDTLDRPTGVTRSGDNQSMSWDATTNRTAIKPDAKQPEQCKTVKTTAEQDRKMLEFLSQAEANPGTYTLGGNNCTSLVRLTLERGGVSTPGFPGPRPFFDALPPGR